MPPLPSLTAVIRSRRPTAPVRRAAALAAATLGAGVSVLGLAGGAQAATLFYIQGGGNGHGIGMSQYGAYGYALQGWSDRAILAHYYQGTALGVTDPTRIVRVLLSAGPAVSFSGATAAVSAGSAAVALDPATTYTVTAAGTAGVQVDTPSGGPVGTFAAPLSVSGPGPVDLAGTGRYRGALEFRPNGQGGVQAVNAVGLDDYVLGVVAVEMSASGWPAAALESQAIAARTYAITTSVHGNGYTLYSDTRSQAYGGVAAETPSTDAAVAATSGEIVTYDGVPAVTYYFASSGGYTESVQNVWLGTTPKPWLVGVPDPYDAAGGDPYHSWTFQMTPQTAAAKLGSLLRGTLTGILVTRHGVSPRILTADVVGSGGITDVTGPQLQSAFGLDSTDAAFTTISTTATGETLDAAIFPAPATTLGPAPQAADTSAPAVVALQALDAGAWQTIGSVPVAAAGTVAAALPGPGSYRIVDGTLDGPAVTAG